VCVRVRMCCGPCAVSRRGIAPNKEAWVPEGVALPELCVALCFAALQCDDLRYPAMPFFSSRRFDSDESAVQRVLVPIAGLRQEELFRSEANECGMGPFFWWSAKNSLGSTTTDVQ
jgi:hypothetical protein